MQAGALGEVRDALRQMLPEGVHSSIASLADPARPLAEAELASTSRMSPLRRQEFSAGRTRARIVLEELGLHSPALPVGPARAPVWPHGFVGSISHAGDVVLAVAASTTVIRAIGIDLEPAVPLESELLHRVCRPAELARLGPLDDAGLWAKLTFSAKESVYKCLAPATGIFLEFEDLEISFAADGQCFGTRGHGPAAALNSAGTLSGRFALAGGFCVTAAWLWASQPPGGASQ